MAEYTGSSFISQPIQTALNGKLSNPATATLNMNDNSITNLNTLYFADGSEQSTAGGGGGATPGGPANSIQYNNGAGGMTGSTNLLYNDSLTKLTVNGTLDMSSNSIINVNQVNFPDYGTYIGKEVGNSFQSVLIGGQAGLSGGQRCISIGTGAGYSQGGYCFAIGTYAGQGQLDGAMALGTRAGLLGQKGQALAIGTDAGKSNQSSGALAIGNASGQSTQGVNAIGIGNSAGRLNQQTYAVAIGVAAGDDTQGANSIAIGKYAGLTSQGANSIILNATGSGLEQTTPDTFTVKPIRPEIQANLPSYSSLFYNTTSGEIVSGANTPAYQTLDMNNNSIININQVNFPNNGVYIGKNVGNSVNSLLIGLNAGAGGGEYSFALGTNAGISQGGACFAIGSSCGRGQGNNAMAIGNFAGQYSQGEQTLAIGPSAGNTNQRPGAIAIGNLSGANTQGAQCIAIGNNAGRLTQGENSVAIGLLAGYDNQGANSIAIGKYAGLTSQGANSIILNATGSGLEQTTPDTFTVAPIRSNATPDATLNALIYTASTGEITYGNKTFIIDHPLQPENYLVHACLEGPEAGVYYRGSGSIPVGAAFVEINLPSYADALATEFTVQVTPVIAAEAATFATLAVSKVEQGKFKVYLKKYEKFWTKTASAQRFDYVVFGKRVAIDTEPMKTAVNVKGEGPYKWL